MLLKVLALLSLLGLATAAENGLARTPPMGWMSWTKFYCNVDCVSQPNACINENLYMGQADRLVSDGYQAVGYQSIHIDDCWLEWNRSSDGKLVANATRFPGGMTGLATYMHDRGLKLAIYECVGTKTCAGYPGSYGFEEVDAQTFADWGIDYLKYDGCYSDDNSRNIGFPKMGAALLATGKQIVFSTEWWGFDSGNWSGIQYWANLERTGDDIYRAWESIIGIIDHCVGVQDTFIGLVKPGFWADPDMLIIGNYEITVDQARAQFSIWAIWSAPLIMSNDLRDMAPGHMAVLQNTAVIAVDQDPMGVFGRMVNQTGSVMTFVKKVMPCYGDNCSYAIVLLNRSNTTVATGSFVLNDIGLTNEGGYYVQDLWTNRVLGAYMPTDTYTAANIPMTGVNMIKATVQQN